MYSVLPLVLILTPPLPLNFLVPNFLEDTYALRNSANKKSNKCQALTEIVFQSAYGRSNFIFSASKFLYSTT